MNHCDNFKLPPAITGRKHRRSYERAQSGETGRGQSEHCSSTSFEMFLRPHSIQTAAPNETDMRAHLSVDGGAGQAQKNAKGDRAPIRSLSSTIKT